MTTLFQILTFAAGCGLIALSFWLRARSAQSRHWPRVEGHVIESRIDDAHLEFLKPVLRYRYVVAGQPYVGFRVSYAGYGISKDAMARLIAPYPVGSAVQVSYDPARPARSVLDTSARPDWGYWFVAGLCFLGLGAWLLQA